MQEVTNMWKRSCKEIRNIVEDRNKLENILVADLPGIDMNKIENQIDDIDNFIESRIIELQVFSKKRLRHRFLNKPPR